MTNLTTTSETTNTKESLYDSEYHGVEDGRHVFVLWNESRRRELTFSDEQLIKAYLLDNIVDDFDGEHVTIKYDSLDLYDPIRGHIEIECESDVITPSELFESISPNEIPANILIQLS